MIYIRPGVQRWGLAALGTICSAEEALAHRAVDAGATKSVIWALGAEVLSQAPRAAGLGWSELEVWSKKAIANNKWEENANVMG
jgi:hypothetical protein